MISVNDPGFDGLSSMSGVWAIVEAARAGAADARSAARGFLPAATRAVAVGLHATGFTVGYAVTFPACLVARVVPRNNAIAYGLADGGQAGLDLARSTVRGERMRSPLPALAVVPS